MSKNFLQSKTAIFIALVFCLLLGGIASLWRGPDYGFDNMNYHIYNAWAFLNGRLHVDLYPAEFRSYFFPLIDLPYYFLSCEWFPNSPRVVAFIMGIPAGGLFFITFAFISEILKTFELSRKARLFYSLLLTFFGVSGISIVSQIGYTSNEIPVACFIIGGLFAFARLNKKPILAGLLCGTLFGVASALKLTTHVFVIPALVGMLFFYPSWRERFQSAIAFCAAWWVAFLAIFGYWGWTLYQLTGNPVFPGMNGLFKSDWIPFDSGMDNRFIPHKTRHILFFPFYWVEKSIVTDGISTDLRFLYAYLVVAIAAIFFVFHKCGTIILGRLKKLSNPPEYRWDSEEFLREKSQENTPCPKGSILVTAGERSVACGKDKVADLPERQDFLAQKSCLSGRSGESALPQAALRLPAVTEIWPFGPYLHSTPKTTTVSPSSHLTCRRDPSQEKKNPSICANRSSYFIIAFVLLSTIIWEYQFSTLRYAIPIEALLGLLIFVCILAYFRIYPNRDKHTLLTATLLFFTATSLAMDKHERPRTAFAPVIQPEIPVLPADTLILSFPGTLFLAPEIVKKNPDAFFVGGFFELPSYGPAKTWTKLDLHPEGEIKRRVRSKIDTHPAAFRVLAHEVFDFHNPGYNQKLLQYKIEISFENIQTIKTNFGTYKLYNAKRTGVVQ